MIYKYIVALCSVNFLELQCYYVIFFQFLFNYFQKLINFTWLNQTKKKVVAYIFWKRDPEHKNYPKVPYFEQDPYWFEKNEKHVLKYYKLRILISVNLEDTPNLNKSDLELKIYPSKHVCTHTVLLNRKFKFYSCTFYCKILILQAKK